MNYKNRVTPAKITNLEKLQIIVAPTNLSGIHGAGLAKECMERHGLAVGVGVGYSGKCYAIPTKDKDVKTPLPLPTIQNYVTKFVKDASFKPETTFLVPLIGCGFAKYKPEDIAPLFKDAVELDNIHLPKEFWAILVPDGTDKN